MWPFKKRKGVNANWFIRAQEKVKFTPDYAVLQEKKLVPVFICNELMQDHFMYHKLLDTMFYGVAWTIKPKYMLWKHCQGDLSTVILLEEEYIKPGVFLNSPARVKGEIYFVKPKVILDLDNYHKNTLHHWRKEMNFLLPTWPSTAKIAQRQSRTLSAHYYVGNASYWKPLINDVNGYTDNEFKLVTKTIPSTNIRPIGDYFHYSLREYERR